MPWIRDHSDKQSPWIKFLKTDNIRLDFLPVIYDTEIFQDTSANTSSSLWKANKPVRDVYVNQRGGNMLF